MRGPRSVIWHMILVYLVKDCCWSQDSNFRAESKDIRYIRETSKFVAAPFRVQCNGGWHRARGPSLWADLERLPLY